MNKLYLALLALTIPSLVVASEIVFADSAGNAVSMECQVANEELAKLMDTAKAAELCQRIENTLSKQGLPKIQRTDHITWKTIGTDKNKAACHIMLLPWNTGQPVPTVLCRSGDAAKKETLETRVRGAIHTALGIK